MIWLLWVVAIVVLLFGFVVVRGAPYVPSHRRYAKLAFEKLYPVSGKDVLVDLGSGDGIILRLAAARGARAIGYELNPVLVLVSGFLSRGNNKIQTRLADFWLIDLPKETTIVYAFSVTRDSAKVEQKLQQTADKNGSDIRLITYGAPLVTKKPIKVLHAHRLYLFESNTSK